jgi:hypothetical protein
LTCRQSAPIVRRANKRRSSEIRAIQPKPGLPGFDAQVNNDELGNGVRASVATWNDKSGRAFQDPSRFGALRLVLR